MVTGMRVLADSGTAGLLVWARSCIGMVFVMSLLGKLHSRTALARFLDSAEALARQLPGRRLAPLVLLGEASVPLLVCFQRTAVGGFFVALALLVAFGIALTGEYLRGPSISCNCFGFSGARIGRLHLLRNAVLSAVSAIGIGLCIAAGTWQTSVAQTGADARTTAFALVIGFGSALFVPVAEIAHDLFRTTH